MAEYTRNFTVSRTHSADGVIVDATGWTGRWPFRRPVSYHVGVNCDAITASGDRLYVTRRGWTIAVAEAPGQSRLSWAALLCPRHARGSGPHCPARAKSPWAR